MLPQQKKGWTTVVDLEEFKTITWSYLGNIKMVWQYQGIAYLFRKEGIPIYGKDLGTLKMNHPIMCMAIPQHKDKNYGVDIYVPAKMKKKAEKLMADDELIRRCAELEETEGKAAREQFNRDARAAKERNEKARKENRAKQFTAFKSKFVPQIAMR